ncbi:hypothetical protein GCM10007205_09200 [Oxalicibacterium flavum]|uniref:Uncharacterized protein n=1 Tax=Oxalicibacterium flavum TaxID=179467 RepID=A0A8J2XYU4_9BURK|nr:hypothetical protein GCM10007205_09200 [Oxalicibacterium flavum]
MRIVRRDRAAGLQGVGVELRRLRARAAHIGTATQGGNDANQQGQDDGFHDGKICGYDAIYFT